MANYQDCIRSIEEAAGRKLTDEEVTGLVSAVRARAEHAKARNVALGTREAAMQAAEEIGQRLEVAAVIEKRNAALNLAKRMERVAWARENFGNNLVEGLEAMLVGVNRAKAGAREGAAQIQEALKNTYLGGLVGDLERAGAMPLFASGALDRDVARALWALGRKDDGLAPASRQALQAFDQWRASGQTLENFLETNDVPPEVNNLLIGLSESNGDQRRIATMLGDYARASQAHPGMTPEDIAANVVEASRSGRTVTDVPEVPGLDRMPPEAVELAKIIGKWQETARLDANEAGAWIGRAESYITRQSHDPERVRGDGSPAAYEAWKQEALRSFDLERMRAHGNDESVDTMLRGIWADLASGNHLKAIPEEELAGFKGPTNLAKKLSQSRVIWFKTADGWHDYNASFGAGNLRESVIRALTHHAEATGLMRVLGTNPGAMFDTIKNDLVHHAQAAGQIEQVAKLRDKEGRLANFMAAVDGSMNIPGNALWARRAANVRSWQTLSKLGGMLLSQLNDVALYAAGTRYQGRGFLTGLHESVTGLGRDLGKRETRDLAASLGVVLDNMAGELGRVGSFGEPGGMARITQLFMKLNGTQWWVNHMRSSAALGLSHHLATEAGKPFAALAPDFRRLLGTYSIDSAAWDRIRASAATHVDGKAYIVPERVTDPLTQAQLRNYLVDQTRFMALEPDAKTRALLLQGTRPGTVPGELMRFVMQFKSFTGAYLQKVVGRELFGRGYEGDSLLGALRNGNGEMLGLAQLMATTTLMGYGSMALKDLAKGRTPRDPTESGADAAKILMAAMVQGGGAGIYGDLLFGQASRFGSGTIESLAGPTISTAGRVVDLYHKALAGDDASARAFNEAVNNTPFANLFYTRAAMNYLFLYRIQESLNPGFLRRMEREAERNNAQGFLLRPSETVH